LCEEAARCGGTLTTFAAVAKAIGLSPGRVTQMFGSGLERDGVVIQADTVGRLVAVFCGDGVWLEIDWFFVEFDDFAARVAAARPCGVGPRVVGTPDASPGDWEFTETTVLPDLVELRLHPPRPGNEVRDPHYVDATLLFGPAFCDYDPDDGQDPRTVTIALSNARLAIGSESYQPLKDTMIGERVESEHYQRVAGGVEITGPAPNGTLEGNPIGDQHLAVIAGTNSGDEPFAATVAANRGSFVVADPDAPPERHCVNAPSNNRNAILNAVIYKNLQKDAAGRALLARATMQRKPEDAERAL
jgi:hypothetical protein